MLSLVNYGSSGESEDDDNDNELKTAKSHEKPVAISSTKVTPQAEFNDDEWNSAVITKGTSKVSDEAVVSAEDKTSHSNSDSKESDNLLSKLPPPISDLRSIPWDQLSKLTYKSRAIRIMAPSIPEDVEEKKVKKLPSKTGSGLLSILPRPKNEFLATPNSLRPMNLNKKKITHPISKPNLLPKANLTLSVKKKEDHNSDSDGETTDNLDFFSLSSAPDVPDPVIDSSPVDISVPSKDNIFHSGIPVSSEQKFKNSYSSQGNLSNDPSSNKNQVDMQEGHSSYDYISFEQQSEENTQLDSEALAALCGSRGLKRRHAKDDEFKIIDINGSELTPDSHELLSKNLTSEQPRPKRSNKDGPTSQQKRKHQIIYLAHQAKEQELELQNTWANNRMSKKQTQAKYGF